MKKTSFTLILVILVSFTLDAQVTIGMDEPPMDGALLQLKELPSDATGTNSSKGFLLPRVTLKSLSGDLATTLGAPSDSYNHEGHIGLVVYNTAKNQESSTTRLCPGIHIWIGSKWQPVISYPTVIREETLLAYTSGEFTYLNPAETNDWRWAYIGKNASDYQPLAQTFQFTDTRDNKQYYATRYYVGYFTLSAQYKITEDYSCDPNNPDPKNLPNEYRITRKFADGVWMNENLKAEKYDPMRDNTGESLVNLSQKGTSEAVTDRALAKWGYPNNNVANAPMGLLYTWAAATNGKGGTDGLQGRYELDISEGEQIQGICPNGWHLPSDREWTDLENAIILKTSLFSSVSDLGDANKVSYIANYGRGIHGNAMRSSTSGSGDYQGKSNTYNYGNSNSGFDAKDSGLIASAYPVFFGTASGWWSSSTYNDKSARRIIYNTDNKVTRNYSDGDRHVFHSVRCVKNSN